MAFDFGAALSGVGQIAPAMSDAAEIRRQRLREMTADSQQAQAARDTHLARTAQTQRESALTAQDSRNANRYTPISSKPERGEDGKWYMLFMDPNNKIQRLPVEGNYDPNAETLALLKQLNVDPDSDLGKQVLLKVKPSVSQPTLKQLQDGSFAWVEKPDQGLPSSTSSTKSPSSSGPAIVPVLDSKGTAVKGKMPATETDTTSQYHWVDNAGQVHSTPTERVTKRKFGSPSPSVQPSPTPQPRSSGAPPTGLIGNDRIIGTGKLPAGPLKLLNTVEPVIAQTDRLLKNIEDLGLANNNQRGYLATSRLNYAAGGASPAGTLGADIAGLSLGSLVEATSALAGSSRSLPALKIALQHTPNAWVDSPQLMHQKLTEINKRLKDMRDEAKNGKLTSAEPPQETVKKFANSAQWSIPAGAPDPAPFPENYTLHKKGSPEVLAIKKGGKWANPQQ